MKRVLKIMLIVVGLATALVGVTERDTTVALWGTIVMIWGVLN